MEPVVDDVPKRLPVKIELEGRRFGLEVRAKITRGTVLLHSLSGPPFVTTLLAKVWCLTHGCGWPTAVYV